MKSHKSLFLSIMLMITITCIGCTTKEVITNQENHTPNYKNVNLDTKDRVNNLINEMSLEEKVGQMVQGARDVVNGKDVSKMGLGSVLSGGGSYPGGNGISDWTTMIKMYQDAALETNHQIPILYGMDAVHGNALVKGSVVFPHNIGLGAANDEELMYQMGAAVAEEMKLIKVLWNFSPCVAISGDPRWGRTYECFSSDPIIVTKLAEAYRNGQRDHGVLSTAKHYVADGSVLYGSGQGDFLIDRGNVIKSEKELREWDLLPYKKLVESGIQIIMASFSSYDGVKLHEHKYLLTDVLKEEYGFQGFIVSDWEAIKELSGNTYEENIILAVNAGIDMLMEPFSYKEAIGAIADGVKSGEITIDRINDAVKRILTVKFNQGLYDDPYLEDISTEVNELGSKKYKDLAKTLVEKSLVLLKNDKNVLPLTKGQKILIVGPASNNVGMQCGGWGYSWQGEMDPMSGKVRGGTTILDGLVNHSKSIGIDIITDREKADEADVVILAIGEIPYAEYLGDTKDLSIVGDKAHKDNKEAIEYVKSLDKPVITLIVAGRNVLITDYIDDWDGVVMCYLPGTEGEAIASVLVGEKEFEGKLPMPYYKTIGDIGLDNPDLLYEVGYGLTY